MNKKLINEQEITKQSELLQEQTNAEQREDRQQSGKLVDIESIEGTPFSLVRVNMPEEEEACFIAMGDGRLTEKGSEEQCMKMIHERNWILMCSMVTYLADRIMDDKTNGKTIWNKEEKEEASE